MLERGGRRFTIRPGEGAAASTATRDGLHIEAGVVRDVAYAGMVTRYLVDLDAGGELQVVRQNLETSSAEALEQQGRRVTVGWREEHTYAIEDKEEHERVTWMAVVAIAAVLSLGVVACGGDDCSELVVERRASRRPRGRRRSTKLGKGEGKVNLIAWAGYVEDGSTDPKVDWVSDFEKETGCQVNVKVGNTSDEMVTLMRTGQYDGVSASGDATLRLIAGGDVAPVNTDLVPNYADVFDGAQGPAVELASTAQPYGIPHGRGANLLMWRSDKVKPAPDSWGAVFDQSSPYKGKVTAYDNPIYIADAALYLKATQPDLKIDNPYELDDKQFQASVDLLKEQRGNIGEYWSDYTKEQAAFANGDSTIGTTWQVIANLLEADKVPIKTTLPKEGATGWSDTWMISSKAKNPNCMYMWMDHIISPKANAAVAEWFGEAPVERRSRARRPRSRTTARSSTPTTRTTSRRSPTGRRRARSAVTTAGRSARTTPSGSRRGRRSRAEESSPARAAPAAALVCCWRGRSAGSVIAYLGSLAVLFVGRVLAPRHVQRRGRARLLARELPDAVGGRRLPHDRAAHDRDRRRGDGHRRAARVPDRVLHGQGRDAAGARPAAWSRC